jgi:hypothetical protein
MLSKLTVLLLTLFSASCEAQNSGSKVTPAQCFELAQASDARVKASLGELSKRLGFNVDSSSPSYLLLRDRAGAPRILLMYTTPEVGNLLVSYKDSSGDFVDLRAVPEMELRNSISSSCPEPGATFSPPTIFE